jgi:outer membrane receptor protein involved in Fe transport
MKTINLITYLFIITTTLLFTPKPAKAQITLTQITGMVIDSATQKPLGYITINLKDDKNQPVKAALTKVDGSFTFNNIKPLKCTLTFVATGYQPKTLVVDFNGNEQNIGSIMLKPQTNNLKEVAITADKPIIKQEIDRISYDLQADPDSKVNSVLDMLRKVPYISVDGDDNILLKGNSSYKIFINGKPSSMVERDPKNILRSMPASTIQRIEVITIPPSKYDAEGLAGIINIITNKKVDNGYNGSVNIYERYPSGPGIGGSFTVKTGKFGINTFGGASIYNSPEITNSYARTTTGASPTNLLQQGAGSTNSKNGYFGADLSYEIDSLNLISGQFNISADRSNGAATQTSLLNGTTGVLQAYTLATANTGRGNGLDASLNYQLGFKASKAELLTFSYRYYTYNNKNNTDLNIFNRVNYPTPNYKQYNNTVPVEQTVQVDFVKPLKKVNVEAGIKGIFRDNLSDYQYRSFNAATGQFEINPQLSNNFTNTQRILAGYNTWQYAGKGWAIKGGARIEQTNTDADFVSTASSVHQRYFNIMPSVSFTKDFKDKSGIKFGYTQRLNRPGVSRLNPYVDRSNPNFQSTGNPNLKPTIVNTMELSYHTTKKASINIGLEYDYAKDLALQASRFDPATNITYTTYENVGTVWAVGTNLNINYPITKKWNFSMNANFMHFGLSGLVNGKPQYTEFNILNASTSTGYAFDKGWRINGSFNINGRNPSGLQGSSNGYLSSSFSVNKEVIKNKLTFSASVSNPFTKYRTSEQVTNGDDFMQTRYSQVYYRSYRFSLNYNFGKLKGGINKNKRGINNDDASK